MSRQGLRFDPTFNWGHIFISASFLVSSVAFYFGDKMADRASIAVINAHVEQLKRDDVRQFSESRTFRVEVIAELRALREEVNALRKDFSSGRR
jgi:hypothetical protein